MSEREGPAWSEGQPVASEVSERIRSILADAEGAAEAIRHRADQDAQARLRAAETESLQVVEEARREAERFLADRIERVSRLSDEILERGQSVVERLDEADAVRAELAGLVRALGETAARLANEVRSMPGPDHPGFAPSASATPPIAPAEHREWAEPDPPAVADPELTDADPEPGRTLAPEPPEPPEAAEATEPPEPKPAGPIEPNAISLADPAPEPDRAPVPEPTPEEIELLERVRAAEAEREEAEGNGNAPASEVVELRPGEPEPELALEPESPEPEPVPERTDDTPPAPADGDAARTPAPSGDQALGARLVALQMAVAGGNRGEVEAHLRRAFDLDEPGAILDDIFGSGTAADKRVAWPETG